MYPWRDPPKVDSVCSSNGTPSEFSLQNSQFSIPPDLALEGFLDCPGRISVNGRPAAIWQNTNFVAALNVQPGSNWVTLVRSSSDQTEHATNIYAVVVPTNHFHPYQLDPNGNMIAAPLSAFAQPDPARPLSQSKEPVAFHYDARDRLTAIFAHHTNVEHRTEFFYDGRDRRIRMKRKQDGRLTQERLFLWSGDALLEERDALQHNRTVRRFFDQGEQHFAYTAPGLSAPTVTSYYYLRDHLGSIRALIDTNGVARARFDYDWWGSRTQTEGSVSTPAAFTGYHQLPLLPDTLAPGHHPADPTLLLSRYRPYSSTLARFLRRDPIDLKGGLNPYAYAANDPITTIDPLGLCGVRPYGGLNLAGRGMAMLFGSGGMVAFALTIKQSLAATFKLASATTLDVLSHRTAPEFGDAALALAPDDARWEAVDLVTRPLKAAQHLGTVSERLSTQCTQETEDYFMSLRRLIYHNNSAPGDWPDHSPAYYVLQAESTSEYGCFNSDWWIGAPHIHVEAHRTGTLALPGELITRSATNDYKFFIPALDVPPGQSLAATNRTTLVRLKLTDVSMTAGSLRIDLPTGVYAYLPDGSPISSEHMQIAVDNPNNPLAGIAATGIQIHLASGQDYAKDALSLTDLQFKVIYFCSVSGLNCGFNIDLSQNTPQEQLAPVFLMPPLEFVKEVGHGILEPRSQLIIRSTEHSDLSRSEITLLDPKLQLNFSSQLSTNMDATPGGFTLSGELGYIHLSGEYALQSADSLRFTNSLGNQWAELSRLATNYIALAFGETQATNTLHSIILTSTNALDFTSISAPTHLTLDSNPSTNILDSVTISVIDAYARVKHLTETGPTTLIFTNLPFTLDLNLQPGAPNTNSPTLAARLEDIDTGTSRIITFQRSPTSDTAFHNYRTTVTPRIVVCEPNDGVFYVRMRNFSLNQQFPLKIETPLSSIETYLSPSQGTRFGSGHLLSEPVLLKLPNITVPQVGIPFLIGLPGTPILAQIAESADANPEAEAKAQQALPAFLGVAFESDEQHAFPIDQRNAEAHLEKLDSIIGKATIDEGWISDQVNPPPLGYENTRKITTLSRKELLNHLGEHKVLYVFGHGVAENAASADDVVFTALRLWNDPKTALDKDLEPRHIRDNMPEDHSYDLVFFNACASAAPNGNGRDFAEHFRAANYVGWEYCVYMVAAATAATEFFERLDGGATVSRAVRPIQIPRGNASLGGFQGNPTGEPAPLTADIEYDNSVIIDLTP